MEKHFFLKEVAKKNRQYRFNFMSSNISTVPEVNEIITYLIECMLGLAFIHTCWSGARPTNYNVKCNRNCPNFGEIRGCVKRRFINAPRITLTYRNRKCARICFSTFGGNIFNAPVSHLTRSKRVAQFHWLICGGGRGLVIRLLALFYGLWTRCWNTQKLSNCKGPYLFINLQT